MKTKDYIYISVFLLFISFVWFASYCDGSFSRGTYKVTFYGCGSTFKTWTVKGRPEINGFGGGFKFTDEDGKVIVVSGNVLIERVE